MLEETIVEQLTEEQKSAVVKLWNHEYPIDFTLDGTTALDASIGHLVGQEHIVLTNSVKELVGWMIIFDFTLKEQDNRWFILLVDRCHQRQGLGTQLLNSAKRRNDNLNGWIAFEEGLLRSDNLMYPLPTAFYEKQDFIVHQDVKWEARPFETAMISWKADV